MIYDYSYLPNYLVVLAQHQNLLLYHLLNQKFPKNLKNPKKHKNPKKLKIIQKKKNQTMKTIPQKKEYSSILAEK